MQITALTQKLEQRCDLSVQETKALFDLIFAGELSADAIKTILLGLHDKGESLSEIEGAVQAMRGSMLAINAPADAIDIVGTGGDGQNTFNVSTAAAFVASGAGACVAKHGNRAATSMAGSSDVLALLGINLDAPFEILERALGEIGIAFLFAPRHHPAMRFVAPVRKTLGVRTIFNLLGPMTNPANVKRHLIGVFDPVWRKPMTETLATLGSETAWVVHGDSGLDEVSSTGPTSVVALGNGQIQELMIEPESFGLPRTSLEAIRGGKPEENARALIHLFEGEAGPYRTIVLLNAACALIVAGKASTYAEAQALAATAIDSGAALAKLKALARVTNGQTA